MPLTPDPHPPSPDFVVPLTPPNPKGARPATPGACDVPRSRLAVPRNLTGASQSLPASPDPLTPDPHPPTNPGCSPHSRPDSPTGAPHPDRSPLLPGSPRPEEGGAEPAPGKAPGSGRAGAPGGLQGRSLPPRGRANDQSGPAGPGPRRLVRAVNEGGSRSCLGLFAVTGPVTATNRGGRGRPSPPPPPSPRQANHPQVLSAAAAPGGLVPILSLRPRCPDRGVPFPERGGGGGGCPSKRGHLHIFAYAIGPPREFFCINSPGRGCRRR